MHRPEMEDWMTVESHLNDKLDDNINNYWFPCHLTKYLKIAVSIIILFEGKVMAGIK